MDIRDKAIQLLEKCEDVVLASVSEDGYPRPCVMSKNRSKGVGSITMSTGFNGVKTRHFLRDGKAGVSYREGGNSVTLTGHVTVHTDLQTKKDEWQDWFIEHFPGGVEDKDYCVLKFEAIEAILWIDGEFVTLSGDQL
ncbi:pyridoxamine 5'-phosphate oxidase family protein [Eubacteriales bacterium OttesenSCG-928-N13]|nr:pyridoxamine 5'-phosphate oxidase family protein [Eubacteriales bacterium OttesenSCG-928-N13]